MTRKFVWGEPGAGATFFHLDGDGAWSGHVEHAHSAGYLNKLMDDCHDMATATPNGYNPKSEDRLAMRVPPNLFWHHMQQFENGANRYFTKDEWLAKLLHNPDYSRFRVWKGKA